MVKREKRQTVTFRIPQSDKIKIENILAKNGETWQSYLEPLAYSALQNGKKKKEYFDTTRDKAIKSNAKSSIDLRNKVIEMLNNITNNKGYKED